MTKFILCLSLLFVANAWAAPDDEAVEAPKDTTIWVYKHSSVKDCDDVEASQADVTAGTAELSGAGVRVLTTEKNLAPEAKLKKRRCGDGEGFVACFRIFGKDKKVAKGLGFKQGGLCGKQVGNRVH